MDGVTQAHGTLLKDTSIQFGFPAPLAAKAEPAPPPEVPFRLGDGSAVFWVVIGVVAVGLLWLVVNQVRGRWTGAAKPKAAPTHAMEARPAIAVPRAALDEADVLAAAGRYGEAVHALLLRGVGAIRQRYPRALGPSLTSRDIAVLPVLPDATRDAFAGIAQRTERAVFARRDLVVGDWEACRALYAGLLVPGR